MTLKLTRFKLQILYSKTGPKIPLNILIDRWPSFDRLKYIGIRIVCLTQGAQCHITYYAKLAVLQLNYLILKWRRQYKWLLPLLHDNINSLKLIITMRLTQKRSPYVLERKWSKQPHPTDVVINSTHWISRADGAAADKYLRIRTEPWRHTSSVRRVSRERNIEVKGYMLLYYLCQILVSNS